MCSCTIQADALADIERSGHCATIIWLLSVVVFGVTGMGRVQFPFLVKAILNFERSNERSYWIGSG